MSGVANGSQVSHSYSVDFRNGRVENLDANKLVNELGSSQDWKDVTFVFKKTDGAVRKQYQVKAVQTKDGHASFMLREKSWLERAFSYNKKYRKPLDAVLPVYQVRGGSRVITSTISFDELTSHPDGFAGIGETSNHPDNNNRAKWKVQLPPQQLSAKLKQTDKTVFVETDFQVKDRFKSAQVHTIKATTSISSLPTQITGTNPIIVLDVDETLVRCVSVSGEKTFEALEPNTAAVLTEIKQKHPNAKFVLISQGCDSKSKLEQAKLPELNPVVFESLSSQHKGASKGKVLNNYLQQLKDEFDQVIFMDDSVREHQAVAGKCADYNLTQLLQLHGPLERMERSVQKEANQKRIQTDKALEVMLENEEDFLVEYNLHHKLKACEQRIRNCFLEIHQSEVKSQRYKAFLAFFNFFGNSLKEHGQIRPDYC